MVSLTHGTLQKFRATVTLKKPVVIEDYWTHKPCEDEILELLSDNILHGDFNDLLIVEIKPVEDS